MQIAQEGRWEPPRTSNHAPTTRPRPPNSSRLVDVETATPAKRITFYRSGDSQFAGVRMAIHKRSFKCFDALLDDLSQKMPLPFGVRTVTTPRGTHIIKHLEELQDGGCYLCSDRRRPKPINTEHANKHQSIWQHHSRIPPEPDTLYSSGQLPQRHRRILLIKNTEPGMRRRVVLNRRSIRNLRAFLEEVSEVMQFHVRKIYTADGRRVDNVQSLMTCPGVLVCVGREALSPLLLKILRKSSKQKLPGLSSRSPGLGPRTPGNGARSPGIQEARSPPHGSHSRASECSEGQESRKSVNFGLETKKSIIHPRSDSSTRSTRLSLSSEKSFGNGIRAPSQQRPAIMNDDIEKRVLVNKDGSLSVEMRVRFRLRNDETLQWSTHIGKSPSLTSVCCPPNHAHAPQLQNYQSESCSDCATVDPDYMDCSNQCVHVSQCSCCYHMQEQQYNLWENPIHSQKQPPVPPPYISSHTHTTVRHTQSSGSSSTCNSMRVVRCRTKLSNCGSGSDSEQSQLVQEETCVVQQVQRRFDMGQNEDDTNVEVGMMSRRSSHSEVVTQNGNARSLSERSVENEMMEEEMDHPLSRVSSSSRVLQSLKEDQDVDDDLPPSASQCSHRTRPSPKATLNNNQPISHLTELNKQDEQDKKESGTASPATSCVCGSEMMDQTLRFNSNVSRTSCRYTKVVDQTNGSEEIKSIVKTSSGISGPSGMSSVCPDCGGYKWVGTSNTSSRASQRSCHTPPQALSNPTSPLQNANDSMSDEALSTQSDKTNLTGHGSAIPNVLKSETPSAISRTSSPAATEKEDGIATSTTIQKSNTPQKTVCATAENNMKRNSSAMSSQSNKSHESNLCVTLESSNVTTTEEAAEETLDKREATSCFPTKAVSSVRTDSPAENAASEDSRSQSSLSVNSDVSIKYGKEERPISVITTKSSKSNVSGKSKVSCHKSTNSSCAKDEVMLLEPNETEKDTDICLETQDIKSNKQDCSTPEERVNANKSYEDIERVASALSLKSKLSTGSSASKKSASTKNLNSAPHTSNIVTIKTPEGIDEINEATEAEQKTVEGEKVEKRNTPSKTSECSYDQMLSPKRIRSSRSYLQKVRAASPSSSNEARGQSGFSIHSVSSSKSGSLKCQCVVASAFEEGKKKEMVTENEANKHGLKMELNEVVEDSRGTEQQSQNSFGSVSLGLPDDQEMCDTDSSKSCISFHNDNYNKDSVKTTANVHSILSPNSKVNESHRAVDMPTIDAPPGSDGDVTAVDPGSSKKSASPAEEKETSLINSAYSRHSIGLCSLASDLAADVKVNGLKQSKEEGTVKATGGGSVQSVKTSSSAKKETSVRSSKQRNCRHSTKGTPDESTMSAADLLADTKAAHQHSQQSSKASKVSSTKHAEKNMRHQMKSSQKDEGEGTEVTPACLPNASPSEVVTDWLRNIPSNNMIALDEIIEDGDGKERMVQAEAEVAESKEEHLEEDLLDKVEKVGHDQKEEECATIDEEKNRALVTGVGAIEASPRPISPLISGKALPKDWRSSAAVMKVLLSSSLGRCRSLPEVSPVYGRRLSTSARGLLDCLAQLQLIEPVGGQGCNKQEDKNRQYGDIIAILQSLWLTEPPDFDTKDIGIEHGTPPRSSSGVGMSTGSGGSGKEQDNQMGDETLPKESSHEDETVEKASEKRLEPHTLQSEAEVFLKQPLHSDTQSQVSPILESPKDVNVSSSDKSSGNDSSNSSTATPPTVFQTSMPNKSSQDPDPVWVLHLLKKLEKEFLNHYINAMAEFKVRWDLDDSLIVDTMISELKDEVSQRIQSSIKREMSKIQSRSGRGGKSPRPPKGANLSRESTMTEKRRRMLKVMKNQSVKTADSFSEAEMTAEFSDQQSDDEYCPCDACVRKKMAARPLRMNPAAAEAPVMMEFDLFKILQLRKTPAPAPTCVSQPTDRCDDSVVVEEEVRSLEVVREEEEDDQSSEDLKTEETVPEEVKEYAGEKVKFEEENEENTGSGETGDSQTSTEKRYCQCMWKETPEESDKTIDYINDKGEEDIEDEAKASKEEVGTEQKAYGGESTKRSEDSVDAEEEDCKVKENSSNQNLEESSLLEEKQNISASAGGDEDMEKEEAEEKEKDHAGDSQEDDESSQQNSASPKVCSSSGDVHVTEGGEADAEDSDTDSKHPKDTSTVESGSKQTKELDCTADGALVHQFTRTSVESQPGSLED